jgi:serine/threonine protein kinase
MNLKPGTKLGPYEILSLLGAGGMGEVFKAHDMRLDRMIALKTLRAHLAK